MQPQSHMNRIREAKVSERRGTRVRGYWNTIPIHFRLLSAAAAIHLHISDCETEMN